MENFTIGDILKATKGYLVKGMPGFIVTGISTDSRTLAKGDLFVALIGERFDGHDFVAQAINSGAMGLLVSRNVGDLTAENIILVEDTLRALGDVARLYRSSFSVPVVGITGSNGKTTTKDMTAAVLSRKYKVLKSEGNLNNAIGVPLMLFRLSKAHEIAVIEMGTGGPGEMARLVEIAQPNVAVITNVGPTHLEFFGSVDNVAIEKGVLAQAARLAVLNADDPRVARMRSVAHERVISYGISGDNVRDLSNTVMAAEIGQDQEGRSEFTIITSQGRSRIHLTSLGKHNIYNALAAASVGILFGIGLDEIKKALESYQGLSMRMQKMVVGKATIIDDTYNSNPVSLRAAIDYLSETECSGKRIVVVGDMLELGKQSDELHREAGCFIASHPIQMMIIVGEKAIKMAEGALSAGIPESKLIACKTNLEAGSRLREILQDGDIALIKGSRGMKMDEIVRALDTG